MPSRRDLLKSAATGAATCALTAPTPEAAAADPFAGATATFDKANQARLPPWAFTQELVVPRTLRPRAMGDFAAVDRQPVFLPEDPVPLGEAYHGIAREWAENPTAWAAYGCDPAITGAAAWEQRKECFRRIPALADIPELFTITPTSIAWSQRGSMPNWNAFPIKCYRIPIVETLKTMRPDAAFPARVFTYGGTMPGPLMKFRIGQPVVVRFDNRLDTEASIHFHGGHNPAHADGFPTFYVLPGKQRDYFWPNILPLDHEDGGSPQGNYLPALTEAQSTIWYHDHAMDITGFNVSKGMAGVMQMFADWELHLLRTHVLPSWGEASVTDPDQDGLAAGVEDPAMPGYYLREPGKEPFFNPFDIPIVLQDKVIDRTTGQIVYDSDGHNGYLGDTFFANGVAWPFKTVGDRKYRLRLLDGANARIYRLRILAEADFIRSQQVGLGADELAARAKPFLQIGKDSWMWSEALPRTSVVLAMANRADLIVDFGALVGDLPVEAGPQVFYLVDTMPQFDGRGPKGKLDDGGDPRVLPLPFDVPGKPLVELDRPIALVKFVVEREPAAFKQAHPDATVQAGTILMQPRKRIPDADVVAVREFVFERGKGAWQVNGRFYDPTIANAAPPIGTEGAAEEWVLRNGGGGWWHPIHIHLESHQLVRYEKDFAADEIIGPIDAVPVRPPIDPVDVTASIPRTEVIANHDTTILGPNTVARIRMRFRTWPGPFVFHCHNLEHEDMRMMFNFEVVPGPDHDPNVAPAARTQGNALTLDGRSAIRPDGRVGELDWEQPPVPPTPVREAGEFLIDPRRPPERP
jgi:FtsP/CotA-like multicopper oxidase with cupredoxin domain